MLRALGNISCDLHLMYFLVNASSPQPWDVAISNFAGA